MDMFQDYCSRPMGPRLMATITAEDLLAAAAEHYGYDSEEARDYLYSTACTLHTLWRTLMMELGMPSEETHRFDPVFAFAGHLAAEG
jgi:hypothetical protein